MASMSQHSRAAEAARRKKAEDKRLRKQDRREQKRKAESGDSAPHGAKES